MTTKVKICGITTEEDALAAVAAGADAIGMVFFAGSKRAVDPERSIAISHALGPFVTTVGLFVNEQAQVVESVYRQTGLHLVQLHGDESPAYCEQLSMPYIKAIRMSPGLDPRREMASYPGAAGFLFDAWQPDQYGGTGTRFDWRRLTEVSAPALIVAGGLTPENVAEAVRVTSPYAVDVSGGVEQAPGIKDHQLMRRFIDAVKRV